MMATFKIWLSKFLKVGSQQHMQCPTAAVANVSTYGHAGDSVRQTSIFSPCRMGLTEFPGSIPVLRLLRGVCALCWVCRCVACDSFLV